MIEVPQETRDKIAAAIRKAWQSPTVRARMQHRHTPAKRAALGRERREWFAALRADPVRYAEHKAKIAAGRKAARERREAGNAAQG
jgi:tripartite-type tricarboxylate transporter receptor subunit TctC